MLNKNQIEVLEHLNGYVEGQTVTWTSDMKLTISKVLELVNNKESNNIDVVTNRLLDVIEKLTTNNKLLNGNNRLNSHNPYLQGHLPQPGHLPGYNHVYTPPHESMYDYNTLWDNRSIQDNNMSPFNQGYTRFKSRQTGSIFNEYLRNSNNPNVFEIHPSTPPNTPEKLDIILSLILTHTGCNVHDNLRVIVDRIIQNIPNEKFMYNSIEDIGYFGIISNDNVLIGSYSDVDMFNITSSRSKVVIDQTSGWHVIWYRGGIYYISENDVYINPTTDVIESITTHSSMYVGADWSGIKNRSLHAKYITDKMIIDNTPTFGDVHINNFVTISNKLTVLLEKIKSPLSSDGIRLMVSETMIK